MDCHVAKAPRNDSVIKPKVDHIPVLLPTKEVMEFQRKHRHPS